jgi:phospholipid/cholesterol/gamma-HCH transport system substrate-binding protein
VTSRSLEIRVGIAVLLASAILIVGVMWFQRFKLVEKRYYFYATFPDVGGLTKDDPIMINGIEQGRVANVRLAGRGVLVEMGVREHVTFPKDSKISLRSIGIMGERFVAIQTGVSSQSVQPGDTLSGSLEAGMSEVMGEAGQILDEAVTATAHLREILRIILEEGRLEQTMSNFHAASEGLQRIAGSDDSSLHTAVRRFEHVTALLDSLVGSRYANLDASLQSFSIAGGKLDTTLDNLSTVSSDLKKLTERLNSGEGTLGRLIADDSLAVKMDRTVKNLDELIVDIKKHPGRYLSIRLF